LFDFIRAIIDRHELRLREVIKELKLQGWTVVKGTRNSSIDYIAFKSGEIVFGEIKTGKAQLTPTEKQLKKIVNSHPSIKYELRRFP